MARQKMAAAQATGKDRLAALRKVAARFKSLRPATEALTRVRAVPTIFPQFDVAVGVGGFPIERFSLVHGKSGDGKSKFVLGLVKSFLALDHFALYIDAERCYDAETQVLTRRGFVLWPQVREDDQIGCWDPEQQSLVYEKPYELTRRAYKGPMRRVEHGGVDLLVTPKHKMYVRTKVDRGSRARGEREIGWNEWALVPADELGDMMTVKYCKHAVRTEALPFDEAAGFPDFPEYDDHLAFLRLIGFFIGDGWVGKKRGRTNGICFGLTKSRKVAYLRELAEELGWPIKEMSNRVYVLEAEGVGRIFRAEFYDENDEKRIPEYLLDLNQEEADAILDGLRNSDGSSKQGAWEYFSTSDQVASAVQRLVIHAGGAAHINRTESIGMNRVMVLSRMVEPVINTGHAGRNTSLVDYDGEIFCAHTRTGIMMVRRNGKPVLSGNTTPVEWVRKLLGDVLTEHPAFLAKRPETYEQTIADVREFCLGLAAAKEDGDLPSETSAIIVVDSIRKLVPENIWEKIQKDKDGDIGRRSAQIKAAMNSNWLDELIPLLEKSGAGMAVIARETEDPDADIWSKRAGTDYKVGGGTALVYDASLGIRIEKVGWLQEGEGKERKVYGERHRITIHKTKVAGREDKVIKAYFSASNGVLVPEGFDRPRDVLELAEQYGVVEKKGSWLWHQGEKIGNGAHNAVKVLHSHPEWSARIEAEARAAAANKDGEIP